MNFRVKWTCVTFLITEQEGTCFTTWRSWILYLSTLNVTISITKKKKNNVQFPLYTAVKSMDINKGQPETPTSYRWCGNWSMIRKPLNCSHFHAITEIHYIILNTSEHTLINSTYTFILLCILFCTLLLHAPLLHLASSVSYWLLVLLKASIFLVDAQSFYNIAIKTIIF